MRRLLLTVSMTGFLALTITIAFARAEQGPTPTPDPFGPDPQLEQDIYSRLEKINPQAADLFRQATSEYYQGDAKAAERDFQAVLKLAPNFPDALRRLSYVESLLNNTDQAVADARSAVNADDSALNDAALASAFFQAKTPADDVQALNFANKAADKDPRDAFIGWVLVEAGSANNDGAAIQRGLSILQQVAPDAGPTHFAAAIAAMSRNDALGADNELTAAEKAGMPVDTIENVRSKSGVKAQANFYRTLFAGGYGLVGWLLGLVALFIAGTILSSLTLTTVRRMRPEAAMKVSPQERLIRTVYRIIIVMASLYFYVSIPVIVLITVGLAALVVYALLESGYIPIQLTLLIGLGTLYTLVAVIRSLFIRIKQVDPGPRIAREEAPRLWALVEEVADRVGTRTADAIFAVPTPEIAVAERGGAIARLTGRAERIMILGLACLPGMTEGELKAIVAHEYGHFSNRDTAGGNLALRVRASIFQMAHGLAAKGQANRLNPVWLFLYGFSRLFARITLGASRLQEILADRTAALSYGARNMADALEHIVRASYQFNFVAGNEIKQAFELKRVVNNLYTLPDPSSEGNFAQIKTKIEEEMSRPTSAYDSHPALKDRLELIRALEPVTAGERDSMPVWNLLPNAEALQKQMSQALYERATQRARDRR